MSGYAVEYQVHESQVRDDDWISVVLDEKEAHEWFDRYRDQDDVLAVRVVRVDRTIIRNHASRGQNGGHTTPEPNERSTK